MVVAAHLAIQMVVAEEAHHDVGVCLLVSSLWVGRLQHYLWCPQLQPADVGPHVRGETQLR